MAWDGSGRRARLPENWPRLVEVVMKRCGRRCEARLPKSGKRCPRPATDVDHVIPGDDHSLRNLRGLCTFHHAQKSSREGNEAKRNKRRPGRRARPHPADMVRMPPL